MTALSQPDETTTGGPASARAHEPVLPRPRLARPQPARPIPPGKDTSGNGLARHTRILLIAARPRQWVKNLLVLAAPCTAGVILRLPVLGAAVLALVAFTLAASSCYLVNDVKDRHLDRAHPSKRHRPVACGALAVPTALVAAAGLMTVALTLAAIQSTPGLLLLVLYVLLTLAYTAGLKRWPWLELAVLAFGFVLRTVAGAVAAGVAVTTPFLLVVASAASLVVASKRASEQRDVPADPGAVRPVLRRYRPADLRLMRSVSAVVMLSSYTVWTLQRDTTSAVTFAAISTVPLAVVVCRWLSLTERGRTSAPETVLLEDLVTRGAVLAWLVAFTATVIS